jgi:sugar lactone lactonase YvrE
MNDQMDLRILGVTPFSGVPGGELIINCQGYQPGCSSKVLLGEVEASIVSASAEKIIIRLPESPNSLGITLEVGPTVSPVFPFGLATRLCSDLHPVANPVIAPDGSIITTISGSRGQQVSQSLIRVTRRGDKIPFHCEIMNPTGLAFSPDGQLYISSRNDGTVLRYTNYEQLDVVAEDLGVPCGIAFDSKGRMYVGDRTGKIFRIDPSGNKSEFAQLAPSVSAYHLAIDAEDRLYVTGPTFAMRDSLFRFSRRGVMESLADGFARPQGLAFLPDGDLLICAAYQGRKGIFKYSIQDRSIRHYITAPILVGLAIANLDLYFANSSSIFHLQIPGNTAVN